MARAWDWRPTPSTTSCSLENYQGGGVIARNIAVPGGLSAIPGLAQNRWCAEGCRRLRPPPIGESRNGPHGAGRWDREHEHGAGDTQSAMPRHHGAVVVAGQPGVLGGSAIGHGADRRREHRAPGRADASRCRCVGLRSHERAIASIDNGWFDDEIVPVPVGDGFFKVDEHPRRGDRWRRWRPLPFLHPELDAPTVTAANSAGLNDAAAMVGVASAEFAAANG